MRRKEKWVTRVLREEGGMVIGLVVGWCVVQSGTWTKGLPGSPNESRE